MGCVSSKILARSVSFQEEISQKFQKRSNGFEELLASSDRGDQLLFLLSTANTVSKRIKAASLSEETVTKIETSDSKSISSEKLENNRDHSVEQANRETINAWDLLAGLEEEKDFNEDHQQQNRKKSTTESTEEYKLNVNNDNSALLTDNEVIPRTRSFHTVEDYDAFLAAIRSPDKKQQISENSAPQQFDELVEKPVNSIREQNATTLTNVNDVKNDIMHRELKLTRSRSSKRMIMSKELTALAVQPFNFSSSGSLKDWLSQGELNSPSSYITPKFGSYANYDNNDDNSAPKSEDNDCCDSVFDPEIVAELEQALQQLTSDEELVIQQIMKNIDEDNSAEEMNEQLICAD